MSDAKDGVKVPDVEIRVPGDEEKGKSDEARTLLDEGKHKEAATKLQDIPRSSLEGRMTPQLMLAVTACAIGSSFQFGFNTGVVNAPQKIVQKWLYVSHNKTFDEPMSEAQNTLVWSVTVAIFAIGGMIGGLLSGLLADKFGRKGGMLLNNIFVFIAAALMGFSKISEAYPLLIVGRFVIGFNAGLSSGLAPLYLTEIGPVNMRGALGSVHQLVITISILVSQILGMKYLLGTEDLWPLLFALTAVPAVIQVIILPLCPETPKYSLILKNLHEQAEKDLKKLRGKTDVEAELDVMRDEYNKMKAVPKVQFFDMFLSPTLRWALFLSVMMMMSQQFSGINVAIYYSTSIFEGAGLSDEAAQGATLGMGTINVAMTVISMILVDRAGRRTLHLAGMGGMWVCSILLVIMLVLNSEGHNWASIPAVILVLAFVVSFATGPGSIPWFYVSELFMQGSRAHANSVAVMTNWTANFIVGLVFLPLEKAIKMYSFFLFTIFLTVFIVFTYFFVPETKGIPIEEIVQKIDDGERFVKDCRKI